MEKQELTVKKNTETEGNCSDNMQNNNNGSSEEEVKKILQMRDLVEKQDPASKEYDDLAIRRFLRARDLDVDKACAMFLKYLRWRKRIIPNGSISESEISTEIAQNKLFMQGSNKKGCPIFVLFGGRHYHNKTGGIEELKRFVAFGLEKICSRIPPGQEKFMCISDLQGWGYSNLDRQGYYVALHTLQNYYPERLEKLYVVHAPYIFKAIWKILYPYIDEKTKTKIEFVEDKKLKSTLLQDIEESQLPEIYGGKLKLVPIQDS
ncbi:SEC14 cytosolic factor-like [Rutidosis leptorrhynchoides]|uniref:SEC14 cytosolic factor-like n=1 Tax=Rutidosis leptorrhynchoides TaxID=125765 RepID=UPI003A98E7CF